MTVETTTAKTGPLACNGSATTFAFDFPILEASHLVVTLTDSDDVETTLTLNTHYTVSVSEYPGTGSISTTATYATGYSITLSRATPQTQSTDLVNSGPYHAETQEAALDKLTMMVQDMAERLSRAILVAISSDDDVPDYAAALAALQAAITAAEEVVATGAVPSSRTISTTSPITGGGDLSANRTFALANSGVSAGTYAYPSSVTVTAKGLISAIVAGTASGSTGWFNVKSYGAAGNGIADDTAAVQAAVAALVSAGGGVLFGPAGEYLMTEKIEITGVPCAIIGDGIGLTKWVWSTGANDGGFKHTATGTGAQNTFDQFAAANCTLLTKEVSGGDAIHAEFPGRTGANAYRQFTLFNVEIRGYNQLGVHTHYWTRGVYGLNPFGLVFDTVGIYGVQAGSQTDSDCVCIELETDTDDALGGSTPNATATTFQMTKCVGQLYYRGIKLSGRMEGFYMSAMEFAEHYYAFEAVGGGSTISPPGSVYGVCITGSHFSSYISAVRGVNLTAFHMSGCLVGRASPPGGGKCLDGNTVTLEDTSSSCIVGCTIGGTGFFGADAADNENGILLDGDSTESVITGCAIRGVVDTGVLMTSGTSHNTLGPCRFYGGSGDDFYNTGTDNVREGTFRGISLYKTSNQSIAHETYTAVSWASASVDTDGASASKMWAVGNATRLVVPAGVTRVRLGAQVSYNTNGGFSGTTALTVKKNGSYAWDGRPVASLSFPVLTISTPALVVVPGDYFEIITFQSSGGGSKNVEAEDDSTPGGGKITYAWMECLNNDA